MMRAHGPLRLIAAALTLAACAAAAPPDPSATGAPNPDAIFSAARKAWGAGAYARYAEYVAVVSYHNGAKFVRRTWETTEDIRHGLVYSDAFSREERANPHTPHGINVNLLFITVNKEQPDDPIGQVAFAIDQDYGLAPNERRIVSTNTTSTFDANATKLPVIGHTGTTVRDYDVSLVDTSVDAQGVEYHLKLVPLRDLDHHRLRELWVDGTTWLPEEAVVAGIGNRPPLTKVPWRIEYRQTEGATYIARETALGAVDYGKAGTLRDVTISFDELALRARPTPYRFGFSNHDLLGEP